MQDFGSKRDLRFSLHTKHNLTLKIVKQRPQRVLTYRHKTFRHSDVFHKNKQLNKSLLKDNFLHLNKKSVVWDSLV